MSKRCEGFGLYSKWQRAGLCEGPTTQAEVLSAIRSLLRFAGRKDKWLDGARFSSQPADEVEPAIGSESLCTRSISFGLTNEVWKAGQCRLSGRLCKGP